MSPFRAVVVAAAASVLTGAAVASGQAPPPTPQGKTLITVSAPTFRAAPAVAPTDFPGVREARRGKPLPTGYVIVGHRVEMTVGRRPAYPTFTIACPRGKTLRTFAQEEGGKVGLQIVGPTPFARRSGSDYVSEPRWAVIADYARRGVRAGDTVSGTVYGLCR